jgi:hypothetical protein
MGRCSRRLAWVNGRATEVGYLAELRLDATARGRFALLRDGYRYFAEVERDQPAELYFTSIGADNARARRLLESGVRGLPAYTFLAELSTVVIPVPRRPRCAKLHIEPATSDDVPEMLRLLHEQARRQQLASVWTAQTFLDLSRQGLPLSRFMLARKEGELVACGALWDQRAFRQTAIGGYEGWLRIARPFLNAAARLFGTPRLPAPGVPLSHAFLSPLAIASNAAGLLVEFIAAGLSEAAKYGLEFLTLALATDDPRLPGLRAAFATQTWRSRLYRVDLPGQESGVTLSGPALCCPEVALL